VGAWGKLRGMSIVSANFKGGRSSINGIKATVFGASGFLGTYVVNRLGKIGSQVLCPHRTDDIYMRKLKLMGDLGAIDFHQMSIRDANEIERVVAGSNVVINLMGVGSETSRWSYHDIHATFPSVLATICAEQGVERFVHVSALGASVDAPAGWSVSKAIGEELVKEAMPSATIVRPAIMFGDEDRFLNRIAKVSQSFPFMPTINPQAKMQPVYVDNVAEAIVDGCLANPEAQGQIYELAGPTVYTYKEVFNYVMKVINEPQNDLNVPPAFGKALAFAVQQLPDPWLTVDGLRYQGSDVVRLGGGTGFEGLGIRATPMEDIAERYLVRFRKNHLLIDDDNKIVRQPRV